ncbi:hypothetical protein B0A55_09198 [Friedmanniomyces simplex]|uniref:Integral membrane protein n=1 Tax=Friedmanniomyces simplex TaxID=329884 RepID=A0A4U0WSI4_9PEZI|nr:hypothetical protein B0A55_09198 [Friedmanniomyces simplex]
MGDYFSQARQRAGTATQERLNAPLPPGPARPVRSIESLRQPSSIRIRRLPSNYAASGSRPTSQAGETDGVAVDDSAFTEGRRRSSSAPQRYQQNLAVPGTDLSRQRTADATSHMGTISEGTAVGQQGTPYYEAAETPRPLTPSIMLQTPGEAPVERVRTGASVLNSAGNAARQNRGLRRLRSGRVGGDRSDYFNRHDEYDSDVVDLLDLIDPEVRTLGTLTNVQNSLFVPDLGGWLNRRPTYELRARPSDIERPRSRAGARTYTARPPTERMPTIQQEGSGSPDIEMQPQRSRRMSISSQLSDSRYAVLPHGVDLQGWGQEEVDELNDHVRHLLHSRREGFKRNMRGFRQYLSRPLGLFVFVYATLVTLFGAAWVFCLIGWIYIGNEQDYFINVIDNVLVALFALIGDGLAPFRIIDTYHMCFIAHYHHLTWRLRKEKQLPALVDHNDLPDRPGSVMEQEDAIDKEERAEFSVLSHRQQRRLQYHQAKFSKTHTFYRPHETATHHAFPLRLLVASVVLLDCHSLFQVALGTCTWSIDYRIRPQALTATILSCSITCNIVAGIIISIGDHRTRKKEVLERLKRQELTEEAIEHVQKKHEMSLDLDRATEAGTGVEGGGKDGAVNGKTSGTDLADGVGGGAGPAVRPWTPGGSGA